MMNLRFLFFTLAACRGAAPEPVDIWNGTANTPSGLQTAPTAPVAPAPSTPTTDTDWTPPEAPVDCNDLNEVPQGCTLLFDDALAGDLCLIDEVDAWLSCCDCHSSFCTLTDELSEVQDQLLANGSCTLISNANTTQTTDTAL